MTLRAPCRLFILAAVGLASQAAAAADKLAFAPPPSWVIPTERPRNSDAPTMAADRAGAALALVQDQVRYFSLGMNDGGMVPASADLTWAGRFGDCKGKTVLLIALLRGLGVEADPVAVKSSGGAGLNARLPVVGDFDHVLVRARLDSGIYWLDGTRTGDRHIVDIAVPAFYWGLPLTVNGSDLVPITPQPLSQPAASGSLRIDARNGLYVPANVHAELILRGDAATNLRFQTLNMSSSELDQELRRLWAQAYGSVDIRSVAAAYDDAAGVERVTMDGAAPVNWVGQFIRTENVALAADRMVDFDRAPATDHDAPFAVPFPAYVRNTETIVLPHEGVGFTVQGPDVDRVAGSVEYKRSAKIEGGTFTAEATERAIAPEFPAAQAQAATDALRELAQSAVYVRLPPQYTVTEEDLTAERHKHSTSADQHLTRGCLMLDHGDLDTALADFDAAVDLAPHSAFALADRGLVYAMRGDEQRAQQDLAASRAPGVQIISPAGRMMSYEVFSGALPGLRGSRAGLAMDISDVERRHLEANSALVSYVERQTQGSETTSRLSTALLLRNLEIVHPMGLHLQETWIA